MEENFLIVFALSLFLALFLTTITIFIKKIVIDEKKIDFYQKEIQKWETAKRKVLEEKNIKKYRKIVKREERIKRMKEFIEKEKMKGNIVSTGIWFLILYISPHFINIDIFFPPINNYISFFPWYIVLSFWLYPLLTRIISLTHS